MAESLFTELKRRNVFKVATAYIVLGWVVIQVTSEAVPAFGMPEWVNTVVFFFGLIGFPFVVLFAWAFELTPEGIKPEKEVDRTESIASDTGKKLNAITIGLLVVALVYFIYESRFQDRTPDEITSVEQSNEITNVPDETTVSNSEIVEEVEARLSSLPGSSIAVLPFVNMSSDPEQEFFSDGISEEILNVLAQIPNLHVTSRSSAFSFKGKEIIVSDVAQKLGVANVLEGSVRKAGNKVRITAQLIEAETDKHLWSATYDRELDDVFAIQDEISQSIVSALREKLGLDEDVQIISVTEVKPLAHQAYLKGRSLIERRSQDDLEIALAEFEKAIEIEPTYARAWMGKAWTLLYLSERNYGNIPYEIAQERARTANEQALKLAPELAESHALRAAMYGEDNEFVKAAESYEIAISLNPNFAYAYNWFAGDLDFTKAESYSKQLTLREKAYRLDPMNILTLVNYSYSLINYGKLEQALGIAEQIKLINPKSHFGYEVERQAYDRQYEFGKSLFASRKSHELSPNIDSMFAMGFGLKRIGLIEEAVAIVEGTELDIFKYAFRDNMEAMITQTRLTLPRSENDSFGSFRRAVSEVFAGNCPEAIKFFQKTNCTRCNFLLHCYKQTGAVEQFEEAMKIRDGQIDFMKAAGYTYRSFDAFEQNQYLFKGNIEQYMIGLRARVSQGYIMGADYIRSPLLKMVREHSDYQQIYQLSEQTRIKQQKIYLDLVAEELSDDKPKDSSIGQGT